MQLSLKSIAPLDNMFYKLLYYYYFILLLLSSQFLYTHLAMFNHSHAFLDIHHNTYCTPQTEQLYHFIAPQAFSFEQAASADLLQSCFEWLNMTAQKRKPKGKSSNLKALVYLNKKTPKITNTYICLYFLNNTN